MAEEQRESNILATGSIDIDVSDALKGLKALRREANETIKVLDQLSERLNKLPKDNDKQAVFNLSNDELYVKGGTFMFNGDWSSVKNAGVVNLRDFAPYLQTSDSIAVSNEGETLAKLKTTHYAANLYIDVKFKSGFLPHFTLKVNDKLHLVTAKEGYTLDLGEPNGKMLDIEIFAYSPNKNIHSEFYIKQIYLTN